MLILTFPTKVVFADIPVINAALPFHTFAYASPDATILFVCIKELLTVPLDVTLPVKSVRIVSGLLKAEFVKPPPLPSITPPATTRLPLTIMLLLKNGFQFGSNQDIIITYKIF
ncbi:hypothetical protein PBCV1_a013L [Paramecium bursaria Chlorella virus 1]|uniref:Uncharacterized protein n=1 Tax=Paramecium bursaria Chlorella virus 1 TaxID=10506 RepID=Q89348_PBCV1|nr:hypothetical protein PBCV1_a013L [Paramecium bursaria Chlorella virus 1]AAC96381.1 hypothetical protein [Paramecium bursaria Chlorella virus 1]